MWNSDDNGKGKDHRPMAEQATRQHRPAQADSGLATKPPSRVRVKSGGEEESADSLRAQLAQALEKNRALQAQVAELEAEYEALYDSILDEKSFIMLGYIVQIRPDEDGNGFVAACQTLHAFTQGETFEEATANVLDAMQVSIEGHKRSGLPVPDTDIETACQV